MFGKRCTQFSNVSEKCLVVMWHLFLSAVITCVIAMSKRNHYFVDEILIPSENLNNGTHGLAQLSKVQQQLSTESNVWKNSTLDKTNSLVI